MKAEIENSLRSDLERKLDPWLIQFAFVRPANSLVYRRALAEAVQEIELYTEVHPADRPDAAAAVYPWLEIRMAAVDGLVTKMTGGDASLAIGKLRQPVEFTSAKAAHARWFVFQPNSMDGVIDEMKSFLQQWTLPFFDQYKTPADMCTAYDSGDKRVINDLGQVIRVAAAMVLCGRNADATAVMKQWFRRPGLQKRYQRVFDYLARQEPAY